MLNTRNYPPSLHPDVRVRDTMAGAGRKVLKFHFQRMLQNEDGTRVGEDSEALHDMRVATRRMRAAFRVFKPYYYEDDIELHRTGLKITGKILGVVRDWDVLFEKTRVYVDSLTCAEKSDLQFLVESWSRERETAREQLIVYLDGESYLEFKSAFSAFVNAPGDDLLDLHLKRALVCDDTPSMIYSRYERVLAHEENLQSPTVTQLHALRIDFKSLRYTVEFFRSSLGETADYCIEELKHLQDYLGDLNDARVAVLRIQQFLEDQDSSPVLKAAVGNFYRAKEAELSQFVATFPQAWARFRQPEFLQKLDAAIKILRNPN
jgi:CHAD domain-containing protein